MKPIVLITGANGMLATHLAKVLEKNYTLKFLTRIVKSSNEYLWDLKTGFIDPQALKEVNHIIHLAGSSIADKRWTLKRKQHIFSSRVDSAQLILEQLIKNKQVIDTFISASAIGYYGATTTDNIFTEESPAGNDFLSTVCSKWEQAAYSFVENNVAKRISIVRMGIILAKNEGALKKIVQPIKLELGCGLGTGKQWMPWIHIEDLCNMYKFILDNQRLQGTFNAVAPEHLTNQELTLEIASRLNRKIYLPNIPAFIIRLLFGKRAVILLEGSRVSSGKIISTGFVFEYTAVRKALNNLL